MTKRLLTMIFVVGIGSLVAARDASAIQIIGFGQNASTNTLTFTNNGLGNTNSTTLTGSTAVTITNIDSVNFSSGTQATFTISATSTALATSSAGTDSQTFSGSFSIISTIGSVNLLSGTFSDGVAGTDGGRGLTLFAATPSNTVTFTSDPTAITDLGLDRSFSLSFSNLSQALAIFNNSLGASGASTASFTGTASAELGQQPVPEPTSMLLLGSGLMGLAAAAHRRRRAKV